MSTQTSPLQPSHSHDHGHVHSHGTHPTHLPPPYSHALSSHSTPLAAHPTPLTAHPTPLGPLLSSTPSFTDSQAFSHLDIDVDVKLQNYIGNSNGTGSASSSSTATSGTPVDLGTALSELSQPGLGSSDSSTHLATPGSSKGKNGATGPADGKSKPHLCLICQRGFTTGGHLQRHQRIHTGVKAFRCPFPGCETRTSRQDNLQQHYRTHLSPSLRRGDGSQARAAVNAAMEAAGMKSTTTRAPRKSKASNGGTTPSSTSAGGSSVSHLPSPYQTPTSQGPSPYVPYLYDPLQHPYGGYPLPPPPMPMMHTAQSSNSSRVPSPVHGHTGNHSQAALPMMPTPPHHQPQFYAQPFPPYGYPTAMHQMYRHFPGMPNPYIQPHPHHPLYSPGGMGPDHAHQMYSPMQPTFAGHSREGSYSGLMTPGYPGPMISPMANGNGHGYPPRTQTSTPISQGNDDGSGKGVNTADLSLSVYGRANTHRPISPSSTLNGSTGPGSGPGSATGASAGPHHRARRTPPPLPPHEVIAQGVIDPSSMKPPTPHQPHQPASHSHHPPHRPLSLPAAPSASASSSHQNGNGHGPPAGSPLIALQPSAFHFHQSPHYTPGGSVSGDDTGTGGGLHPHLGYGYSTPQSAHALAGRSVASVLDHRTSISSQSDGSGGGEDSQKG